MTNDRKYGGATEAEVLALGRVAWAAINLEDRTGDLAEMVLGKARGKAPIGEFIKAAILELDGRPASAAHGAAAEWLGRAATALVRRNQIMHSLPAVMYPGGGQPFLIHWPNSGGDRVETPLDPDVLNGIADQIESIREEWAGIASDFDPIAEDATGA